MIQSTYTSLLNEIKDFWEPLPDKPEENPESILQALWLTAQGKPASVRKTDYSLLSELKSDQLQLLRNFISLKKKGIPTGHICKRTTFLGIDFITGPTALIPRVETEILGNCVLEKLKSLSAERGNLTIIDVCTGCGNLALSFAHYFPQIKVYAADLSIDAVTLAKENAKFLKLSDRVTFKDGDLFAPFQNDTTLVGNCDLVCCNPPYISTAKVSKMHQEISSHEPELAFNGGVFGISILSRVLKEAPGFLKPSSWFCFEIGLGQGQPLVSKLQKDNTFSEIETGCDENGNIRVILAKTIT